MGKKSGNKKKNKKVILPPSLPPEVDDDEIQVSDEDLDFVQENPQFTNILAKLDRKSIDKHVTRVADHDEGELEALYEKRNRKARLLKAQEEEKHQVDPVDALPTKTLDGELVYRTAKKAKSEDKDDDCKPEPKEKGDGEEESVQKAEGKKKSKSGKEDKKAQEEEAQTNGRKGTLHSEVLEKVQQELSIEESVAKKKAKLAEIGMALLEDPESNIRSLSELLHFCNDNDHNIVKLGLMSLLAVFRDIIPSYRIRELTREELDVQVSNAVKKMRYYEHKLVEAYKEYINKLSVLEKRPAFRSIVVRCMCTLLDAAPHFNYSGRLLVRIVQNLSSSDDVVRKTCCQSVKTLFLNEGKHRGEATVEAVRLIAEHVKFHDCQLHPDSIEVLLSLRFDENLGKRESKEEKEKPKKNKKWQKQGGPNQLQGSDKKKGKEEMISKTREEVDADLKAVSFAPDPKERRRMQSETLSAVFETYFRILKHCMDTLNSRSESNGPSVAGRFGVHPLLAPCLDGLGKFSHLIDLDFMGDLMTFLKRLAGYSEYRNGVSNQIGLTVSERLQCCTVAFKVMRSNLDALNVDLQDFFVQFYNLILEYRPDRDRGEVLAEALKTMLWEGKQHDMQRAAAFIKRLATFSLSFGAAEAMAALITLKHLLQKNTKCRSMLENDAGGGSLAGLVAKYQPEATDPYLSGALASVLWELSLLMKHYNPSVSSMTSNILSMVNLNVTQNPVPLSTANPLQAFRDLSIEKELSGPISKPPQLNRKRKRRHSEEFVALSSDQLRMADCSLEDEVKVKLRDHFTVLRDISENERLRAELNRTVASVNLYEEYKKQKKQNSNSKTSRTKKQKA